MHRIIIEISSRLPQSAGKLLRNKGFLYLMVAGLATLCDITVYFLSYQFLFSKQDLFIGSFRFGAPGLSLAISYSCGLMLNFSLSKWIIFTESNLRTRHQFFRFTVVAIAVLFANYGLMKILIETFGFFPTIARASSAISIGVLSFTIHKAFSFRIK